MSEDVQILVKCLPHHEGLPLPGYMSRGAAGMDLTAAVREPVTLKPGERALIPTGISIAIPEGYEVQVRPRSGLAHRNGVGIVNAPGTIDADYRGEIQVILINLGNEAFTIERGSRIAQMIVSPCIRASLKVVEELDVTMRNTGGFGHTGL